MNKSLRQIKPNGLPDDYIAMSDARVEPFGDGVAVTLRVVVTDPAKERHAMILQFFVHADSPAGARD